MRISRLAAWAVAAVVGCPGIVETTTTGESPAPTPRPPLEPAGAADPITERGRHRGRWVTAAAVILVAYGGLGILYAPLLGGVVWTFLGVGISALTLLAVANLVTGVGLFRLDGWARTAAVLVSASGLLFLHAPALSAAMATGAWTGIDWLGLVGTVVVLFAVLRRWPVAPAGGD